LSNSTRFYTFIGRNAVFYQQQAILRKANTPLGAASSFFRLLIAWKSQKKSASQLLTMISLAVTPILVAVGFAAAGIFASRVESAAGLSFLLEGNSCGR